MSELSNRDAKRQRVVVDSAGLVWEAWFMQPHLFVYLEEFVLLGNVCRVFRQYVREHPLSGSPYVKFPPRILRKPYMRDYRHMVLRYASLHRPFKTAPVRTYSLAHRIEFHCSAFWHEAQSKPYASIVSAVIFELEPLLFFEASAEPSLEVFCLASIESLPLLQSNQAIASTIRYALRVIGQCANASMTLLRTIVRKKPDVRVLLPWLPALAGLLGKQHLLVPLAADVCQHLDAPLLTQYAECFKIDLYQVEPCFDKTVYQLFCPSHALMTRQQRKRKENRVFSFLNFILSKGVRCNQQLCELVMRTVYGPRFRQWLRFVRQSRQAVIT